MQDEQSRLQSQSQDELFEPVRWGILGPGLIARGAIMTAFATTPGAQVLAVASRDGLRAESFAADFNVPRAYANYAALLADPEIEAIYIALPNHLHQEWTMLAAAAGKHVLCEKPLAHTLAHAEQMAAASAAADVLLMEAVMYRFHPRMRRVAELIDTGAIGTPMLLRASFCFTMSDPDNYRNYPEMGGGALLDVGSYCINAARWLFAEEPITAMAFGSMLESGADESVNGMLAFPSGAIAQIQCSFGSAEHQQLDILGTDGSIIVNTPFTAWHQDESAILLRQAGQDDELLFAPADPYALMLAHFSACIRGEDDLWWPAEDGVCTMRAIEALRRSIISGRAERV